MRRSQIPCPLVKAFSLLFSSFSVSPPKLKVDPEVRTRVHGGIPFEGFQIRRRPVGEDAEGPHWLWTRCLRIHLLVLSTTSNYSDYSVSAGWQLTLVIYE